MSDSVEDLLAQLKAKHVQDEQAPSAQPAPFSDDSMKHYPTSDRPIPNGVSTDSSHSPSSNQTNPTLPSSAHSIDELLADISHTDQIVNTNIAKPGGKDSSPFTSSSYSSPLPPATSSDMTIDPLLSQLKAQYAEQDRQALEQQQQHLQQQQRRQQEQQQRQQQQQRAAQVQRAESWLKSLDPHGGEGIWFEQFAAKYESRLEAAIDYLGVEGSNPDD